MARAPPGHDPPLKAFPEILFVLWGEGEEPEDLWKCYDLGARMQEAPARIEYPPSIPTSAWNPAPQPEES